MMAKVYQHDQDTAFDNFVQLDFPSQWKKLGSSAILKRFYKWNNKWKLTKQKIDWRWD